MGLQKMMMTKIRLIIVMGLKQTLVDKYITSGLFKPDENGLFSLAACNKAYLEHKRKLDIQQVITAQSQLTFERIGFTKVRRQQNEIILAKAREEVIETDLVIKQASFLFVACRQKLLTIPTTIARKLLHQTDIKKIVDILTIEIHKALKELADFEKKVVDPDFQPEEK